MRNSHNAVHDDIAQTTSDRCVSSHGGNRHVGFDCSSCRSHSICSIWVMSIRTYYREYVSGFFCIFQISTNAQFGHTLPGLVLFCLPAGMVVFWLFHTVFKCPMFLLRLENHQARLMSPSCGTRTRSLSDDRRLLMMASAAGGGACTHLVWDSCTHASGWTVQHAAMLLPGALHVTRTLRVYKILQHGVIHLGTLLLIVWYWRWFSQAPDNPVPLRCFICRM